MNKDEVIIEKSATKGYSIVYADGISISIPDNFAKLIAAGAGAQRRHITIR